MMTVAAGLLALTVAACDFGSAGPAVEEGDVRVALTDAPAEYIQSAWVDIGAVELLPQDGSRFLEPAEITADGTDGMVDLLSLQDGSVAILGEASIPAGEYVELRLELDSARVTLESPYTFDDGSSTRQLSVPAAADSGIVLNTLPAVNDEGNVGGIDIAIGQTILIVDFDVNRSFTLEGSPDSAGGITGAQLTPVLRIADGSETATISGNVVASSDTVPTTGLLVTARDFDPPATQTFQTTSPTALTGENGRYELNFVVPGTYEVFVETPAGFSASPDTVTVTIDPQQDEMVDFDLVGSQ